MERLKQLPVEEAGGIPIPLEELADVRIEETPSSMEHESNRRRTFVSAYVRGRDVATFNAEVQAPVAEQVTLPTGNEVRWSGDFENPQSASPRLMLITPVVLLLIFLLLYISFGSTRLALLIFSGRSHGGQWRHFFPVAAEHAIQHFSGGWLYCFVWSGRAERTGVGECGREPPRVRHAAA